MNDTVKPVERLAQGAFTQVKTTFLKKHLPNYLTRIEDLMKVGTGPKIITGTKGNKKAWVEQTVYPTLLAEFGSAREGGPNLESLKTVSLNLSVDTVAHADF
jgi:hypothetical protein